MSDIDQTKPRLWSNAELNDWIRQCLTAEREAIRQLTIKGQTKTTGQVVESLSEIITKTSDEAQAAFDVIGETFKKQQTRIQAMEAEIAELKANQKKRGWFS